MVKYATRHLVSGLVTEIPLLADDFYRFVPGRLTVECRHPGDADCRLCAEAVTIEVRADAARDTLAAVDAARRGGRCNIPAVGLGRPGSAAVREFGRRRLPELVAPVSMVYAVPAQTIFAFRTEKEPRAARDQPGISPPAAAEVPALLLRRTSKRRSTALPAAPTGLEERTVAGSRGRCRPARALIPMCKYQPVIGSNL
ncbi:MAG: hypothetical protein K9L70_01325 [Thiohalocapsa sp.]|nr:hypothetical protein [Thiohalocapsa sp.]MCF7991183.1 hypothetical protein [Thiohalocapsa sp.]